MPWGEEDGRGELRCHRDIQGWCGARDAVPGVGHCRACGCCGRARVLPWCRAEGGATEMNTTALCPQGSTRQEIVVEE